MEVGKMTTEELTEAISAEEAMNTIQKGILNELIDIECDMIRGQNDFRFYQAALARVQRLKKELIADTTTSSRRLNINECV